MSATGYAHREVTQPPDWHGLVVWDFLFNAATTGLFLVAAVADLARPSLFGPAAAWAYPLALGLLFADLMLLVADLGHPTRFHHMLRVVKPSSPMSLGTWCLTAYSLPLTVAAAASLFGWDEVRRIAAAVGLLPAVGAVGYKGVLFSTSSQPGWRDARWLGAYHTASAVALGSGGLLLLTDAFAPAAAEPLRIATALTTALAGIAFGLLLLELGPELARRYSGRVRTTLALLAVGWIVPVGLTMVGTVLTDALSLAFTAGSAFFVRRVVILLPHRPVG